MKSSGSVSTKNRPLASRRRLSSHSPDYFVASKLGMQVNVPRQMSKGDPPILNDRISSSLGTLKRLIVLGVNKQPQFFRARPFIPSSCSFGVDRSALSSPAPLSPVVRSVLKRLASSPSSLLLSMLGKGTFCRRDKLDRRVMDRIRSHTLSPDGCRKTSGCRAFEAELRMSQ